MKYLEWLKTQLGEETFNKLFPAGSEILSTISTKLGEKKIVEDDGKLVPYSRFEEVNKKLNDPEKGLAAVTAKLTTAQGEIETLKTSKGSGNKTLEERFQTLADNYTKLENTLKEKDTQMVLQTKTGAVEKLLRANKVNEKYLQTALREFNVSNPIEKLEIVNGEIKDAETIVKPFVDNNKIFFGEFVPSGTDPKPGDDKGQMSAYENMTDAEYFAARAVEQKK